MLRPFLLLSLPMRAVRCVRFVSLPGLPLRML
jgi:hypothetical protein